MLLRKYYERNPYAYRLLLMHSEAVALKAVGIARSMALSDESCAFIKEASLLHDIGIFMTNSPGIYCYGDRPYIEHGYLGRRLLEGEGLARHALVCERHVGVGLAAEDIETGGFDIPIRDMLPVSVEERIVCYADKFYSKHLVGEKPLETVRESIARYGESRLRRFDLWHEEFILYMRPG